MSLNNFEFKTDYNKATDDIAKDFYMPCMGNSKNYDRISGYFGSTVYIIAWDSIKTFIKNNGKMRLICSPLIIEEDKAALSEGYSARQREDIANDLKDEIKLLMKDDYLEAPSRALACFVAMGIVDIKIAVMKSNITPEAKRLFHDKVGIFRDEFGNSVGFRGSMNETFKGLSNDGNLESIDVFPNWVDKRDKQRVDNAVDYFEKLWENELEGIEVYDFPSAAKDVLTQYVKNDNWEELVDQVKAKIDLSKKWAAEKKAGARTPREHQIKALEGWKNNNYRGIFEHATGSGKTFTAMCAINHSLSKGKTPVVLVPSTELLHQWYSELRSVFEDAATSIFLCGAGNNRWKKSGYLNAWTQESPTRRKIIVSTMDTAASDQFLKSITQGEHLFLVADEVHRLGSPFRRKVFNMKTGWRLGLSATPKRYGDDEGTNAIFDYFGGIVPPIFSLNDAIKAGVLTKYFYFPHEMKLTQSEQDAWDEITKELSKAIAQKSNGGSNFSKVLKDPYISNMLIKRARIVKNAQEKVKLAKTIIENNYRSGQRWIVYCDNQTQLTEVLATIRSLDLDAYEYHSAMLGDRNETLKYFSVNGGILVSIKCLDEGVDIPAATHALILASSKNPREFIQRRGRILRKSKNKSFAYLYDAIVTPNKVEDEMTRQLSIIESELARAVQFGEWAENPACITKLRNIAIDFGIDIVEANEGGYESDDE